MGQSRPLFVYFRSFLVTISTQIEKSIDGVLGIRTRGCRMVGADKTTELWRHIFNAWIEAQVLNIMMMSQNLYRSNFANLLTLFWLLTGLIIVYLPFLKGLFYKFGQPRHLFVYFRSFQQKFYRNIVDFSGIWTQIVRVGGEPADRQTTTRPYLINNLNMHYYLAAVDCIFIGCRKKFYSIDTQNVLL